MQIDLLSLSVDSNGMVDLSKPVHSSEQAHNPMQSAYDKLVISIASCRDNQMKTQLCKQFAQQFEGLVFTGFKPNTSEPLFQMIKQ